MAELTSDLSHTTNSWVFYLLGIIVVSLSLLLVYFWIKRKTNSAIGKPPPSQATYNPNHHYRSKLSNCILELAKDKEAFFVTKTGNEKERYVIPFDEIISGTVTANGQVIAIV